MVTPIKVQISRTQPVMDAFAALFSATFEVDEEHEAPWIKPLLENIANNLTALEAPDWKERISRLMQALNPRDALLLSQSEIPANGQHFVTEFFRHVPLLTKEEVTERMACSNSPFELNNLMQVTFRNETFYIADQFAEDGSLHSQCVELMSMFRKRPDFRDWDIAMWWNNPTGWLSDDRPRDVFKEKFEAVKNAAEQEILQNKH